MKKTAIYVSEVGDLTGITAFCCADYQIKKFDKQYALPHGMTYDSYLIDDEKITVVDGVDHAVEDAWRAELDKALSGCKHGRIPAYLIVQHLEPDHSASIGRFMADFPQCQLVCSSRAATMLEQFAPGINPQRVVVKKEGETLEIGTRTLRFFMAPMVHWPEVMVSYDEAGRVFFSADAFGSFDTDLAAGVTSGSLPATVLAERWEQEARRYYINICGKFGPAAAALLGKMAKLEVKYICPLHGPVIPLDAFNPMPLYKIWSSSVAQKPDSVLIACASLHGNTLDAAHVLGKMLSEKGVEVKVMDLTEDDMSEAVAQAFGCGIIVFMSATYDGGLTPAMMDFIYRLRAKGWKNRTAAIVENGSWAPLAAKLIRSELEGMKEIRILEPVVTILTALNEKSRAELGALASVIVEATKVNQEAEAGK